MQQPPLLHMLNLQHHITIAAPARGRHNILVKRKRDKHNHHQQIHNSAHAAHALGDLLAVVLAHVDALEPCAHKRRSQPADQREAGGERQAAEGERRDERLAIALEGVGEDGDASERE